MKSIFFFIVACVGLFGEEWISEGLYPHWKQVHKVERVIHREETGFQDLILFENQMWGRVLALDGVIQLTERDEFVYHEMMAHVPLIAHGNPKKVLVVGGGDGGIVREVLRHSSVEKVVLVEIDPQVVSFSKEYLPFVSQGSLDDPRVEVVIADGMEYVRKTGERFDVILCDSTDPHGPGAILFSDEFYRCCREILRKDGIFVNQSGVPALQGDEYRMVHERLSQHFTDVTHYLAVIPTYVGGFMALGWATNVAAYREIEKQEIERRIGKLKGEMKYYNADIHWAAFALPNFIR